MNKLPIIKESDIASLIYIIRGEKVMLDADIARLYNVETRILKQAVRRNLSRFPDDFMFELTNDEIDLMVSQNGIPSKQIFGGAIPFAFTEQGIAMLSSVLRSEIAVKVNIAILRTFVRLRQLMYDHKDLYKKIEKLEQKYDDQFKIIFTAIQQMLKEENEPCPKVGFRRSNE
jgi:flagellar capping protein FliD